MVITLATLQRLRSKGSNQGTGDMAFYWALTIAISLFLKIPEQAEREAQYLEEALNRRRAKCSPSS